MKPIILSCFLALIGFFASSVRAAEEFDGYIRELAAGTSEQEAVKAMRALGDAGERVFPVLLAHLDDRTPASNRFGKDAFATPTVGQLCFDILQTKIEDNWPKGFQEFYVLTPANAKQWLDERRTLSLRQLRLASREESLRRAEAESTAHPSDLTAKAVAFLREEVAKLKR